VAVIGKEQVAADRVIFARFHVSSPIMMNRKAEGLIISAVVVLFVLHGMTLYLSRCNTGCWRQSEHTAEHGVIP
jgi:hypothetical protein